MGGLARVWLTLAGLVAGVLCAAPAPALVAATAVLGGAFAFRRRGPWRGVALVAVAFSFGAWSAAARAPERQPLASLARAVPSCDASGRTLEDAGGLGILAGIDVIRCDGSGPVFDAGPAFLDDFAIEPGRRFSARGWLIPLDDESFGRARARAGAAASLRVTEGEDEGPLPGMHGLAGRVRAGLAAATAPLGRPGALLRGLAIGDTSGIDPPTEEALRRSGLAHLLAVSGSNVAILLAVVALACRAAPLVAKLVAGAAALVAFVAVVGPDASVLRAAGMGAIVLAALSAGRRTEPLHALGLALTALVALRPGIVFSTGLHLSVAATLGIVLWAAPIAARFGRLPRPVAAALGATVSAQVAVTPLLAGVFGSVSVAGLPANLLALPAVPPATVLGLLAGAAAPWSPDAAAALGRLAAPFSALILRVGEAFGGQEWASLALPPAAGAVLAVPVVAAAARAVPAKLSVRPRSLEA